MKQKHHRRQAVIYARFSPRRNADKCESVETQLERCRDYCRLHDLEIIGEYADRNMSGKRADNRPGFQEAMEMACKKKAVLVVYSLSRFARSTKDAILSVEKLSKANADLASLHEDINTASAMGRFVFRLMSALAELEREQIAERTSDAMRRHQSTGRNMSGDKTPYGWKRNPSNRALMIEDDHEQAIIQDIIQLHNEGKGPREITRIIEAKTDCRGGKWYHTTVMRIIQRAGI